ncbi:unnamed protein product [Cyclocybe aegerita]|uniref:Required for respiratory growth protein 9, mitochondrial n=1 Tax=Cyclocybe aegerita TaxID=1973307 RepID=A0A8S0VVR3_CYCAE|nr:unnamed protein product [Cyclocybe aegerita]
MASLLRFSSFDALHLCRRQGTTRRYTQSAFSVATQKWQLAGIPRPRSILEDDEAPVDLSEDNEAVNGTRPNTAPVHLRRPPDKPTPHEYKAHREALRKEFPEGWSPPRKLSREAMDALRQLNRMDPDKFTTPILADKFKISPEAVRRILKSRWEPSAEKRMTLVLRERKEREAKQRVRKERQNEMHVKQTELDRLKKLLRNDNFFQQKYGRQSVYESHDEREVEGVVRRDRFSFR